MDAGIGIGGMSLARDEVASNHFNPFQSAQYETSIKEVSNQTFHPISSTGSGGPFHFNIPADPDKWTDCESVRLHGKMRIRKKTGATISDLVDADKVAPIDNCFQSLWSNVRVKLNGTEITDPTGRWYSYKSFLENKCSYSSKVKEVVLKSRGLAEDTPGKFTTCDNTNKGWEARRKMFQKSKWNYFCVNLHSDITTLRKFLPPNIKIEIELERNSDDFCLMGTEADNTTYLIEIENLRLSLKRYLPNEDVKRFYEAHIAKGHKARFTIDRSVIKTYTVKGGTTNLSHYGIISGDQLPDQVVIGIVKEESYNGKLTENPYEFNHHNLSEASLVVNGRHEPSELYRMNKDIGDTADIYEHFLENTGIKTDDREFAVSKENYLDGSFLLVWDRTPDKCNRYHRHQMDGGTLDTNINLKTSVGDTLTVIIYATYSTDLIIDDKNNVIKMLF